MRVSLFLVSISMKADLWRHNSKLCDLFYSFTGWLGYTSPGSLFLGWLSLPSLSILPPSLTLLHILVHFLALTQFLTCTGKEKTVWFPCFLHLLRLSGIWSDFLSQGSFQRSSDPHSHIPSLEIKRKVLVLSKSCNIWVGREISWKGMLADEGFCGRQGQCRGLGQKIQWRM